MAKKPRKDEDTEAEAGGEGEAGAADGASKKKKLILFGAIGAVVLVLAGGGAWFFLFSGGEEADAETAAAEQPIVPAAFVEVPQMTVNLAPEQDDERPRYLRFTVRLEVAQAEAVPEIEPLMPRIQDAFQTYVRELRPSDLQGSAGVYRLREELLRRVNIAVHPARVDAVLFGEVVVQ